MYSVSSNIIVVPDFRLVSAADGNFMQHPGQKEPNPKPDLVSWISQTNSPDLAGSRENVGGTEIRSHPETGAQQRKPFTPQKSAPEIIPETPASGSKTESCTQQLSTTYEDFEDNSAKLDCSDSVPRFARSRRRARALESSDEESENIQACRKKKRTISTESSDEDVEVVDVDGSTHLSVSSSSGEIPAVDLTGGSTPQEAAVSGIDSENQDHDDDMDACTEDSVKELLNKCEEVGVGLRKQVELAVIEQPKCVGCDKLRLKKYQLVGLSWLNNLHMQGVNGILAGKNDSLN